MEKADSKAVVEVKVDNKVILNSLKFEVAECDKDEYLLQENKKRFVLYPIKHDDIWKMVKLHESVIWHATDIKFTKDREHWAEMDEKMQKLIKYVIAFFAASDGFVMENISLNFINEIQIPEARAFYNVQNFIESVHSETYSLLIDTYISDEKEKDNLFNSLETNSTITAKANWAMNYMDKSKSFAQRLLAFSIVEGVFFSGSFSVIFWIKSKGKMPGLTSSNEYISRDEGLHRDFACLLYTNYVKNKLSYETITKMLSEAVEIETKFICEALPERLDGINSEMMIEYIKYIADNLLVKLKLPKFYNIPKNPCLFIEQISLQTKPNFFEKTVTVYEKAGVNSKNDEFSLTEDV